MIAVINNLVHRPTYKYHKHVRLQGLT